MGGTMGDADAVGQARRQRPSAGWPRTPAPALRILCLSPAVAEALSDTVAGEIAAAALPNEEALLNLLIDRGFQ